MNSINGIKRVELQYIDLLGFLRSFTITAKTYSEEEAFAFDGSSVEGFVEINESDLVLKPDRATLRRLPWAKDTARVLSYVYKPDGSPFARDPRFIALKAERMLREKGLEAKLGPEIEFHIVKGVKLQVYPPQRVMCYEIFSEEFPWEGSYFEKIKKAYHTPSPFDAVAGVRDEISRALEEYFGIEVEMHHHEVASGGQVEIGIKYGGLLAAADNVTTVKYVARNIAARMGYTAIFMPKPFAGDNGNGMHTHISIWAIHDGKAINLFHDENDELGLSQFARYFIGGLVEHGRALAALVAPTVNSYRRLVPGYEAPVYLVWGPGNRSAAIRVPTHAKSPSSKRIEFRPPDPTANPYLAFTAIVAAGLDGVNRKIEPGDPITENVYKMPTEKRRMLGIKELPRSLEEALDELESDTEFLQGYIERSVLEAYIEAKRAEARMIREFPSPMEFYTYLSL